MTAQSTESPSPELIAQARHIVHERLALLSATIWVIGTFLIFINIVPPTTNGPTTQIVISMMAPVLPAALPWLSYGFVSGLVARKLARDAKDAPSW